MKKHRFQPNFGNADGKFDTVDTALEGLASGLRCAKSKEPHLALRVLAVADGPDHHYDDALG